MKKPLILLVTLMLFSCDFNKQQDDTPIEFSLSASKTNLKVDESAQLTISLKDKKDAERAKFTYASSDETILKPIKFENNVITLSAIEIGTATITITETTYQTSKTINFLINTIDITLNEDFVNLQTGNTFQLTANVDGVKWESSDSNIATVTDTGLVSAVSTGYITIKASYKLAPTNFAECTVIVNNYTPTKTTIQQTYRDYGKNLTWDNYASTPSAGHINLLIIPVWFIDSSEYIKINDNPNYKEYVREDIGLSYLGNNEEVGYRSVKTYYEEESGKKIIIDGLVTNWYNIEEPSENYKDDSSQTRNLLNDAVNWAEQEEDINRKDYDSDGDGYMDGVILIYGRPNYNTLGEEKNNFWAYCGRDTNKSPDVDYPTNGVYFWASYDFMYGGDDRFPYTYQRTGAWYGSGNPYREIIDTKTYIHEMGHMYGLPDYYDYTGTYSPAGEYTMQDENVSTHDPYSYIALNWVDPYIPTESCTIAIGDFPLTHDVILLTPEWNDYDSAFDEYILLELYSLTGLNEHYKGDWFHGIMLPDGIGIRVWHVDARLLYNPRSGYSASKVTSNVNEGNNVYKLCDNSHAKIDSFPGQQRGSFICPKQNMLQLISQDTTINHGLSRRNHFNNNDLFYEGDTFTMDDYKKQFLDINSGEFYTDDDDDILLNNEKKLGWSFKVEKISTNAEGKSTAIITLTKLS